MNADRRRVIFDLLEEAVDLSPAEREAYLSRSCRDDASLRAEVQSLLIACDDVPSLLDASVVDMYSEIIGSQEAPSLVGQQVGPYRLVRYIASGGMGAVYLAMSPDSPHSKEVAVKFIRRRALTPDTLRRFRIERQALAVLHHPHIAALLDGGVTDTGLPYLVMEYVDGPPIDKYCDEKLLATNERLELFRTVCSGVAYAHRNLIVHRDLKPNNILVTSQGIPKLLDFGIAKVLGPHTGDQPGETTTRNRILTPEYASPEHIRGEAITTASDVYSLGVILYGLLTGHSPYRFKSRIPHEIERTVCEQDPEKPSTAILRPLEALPSDEGPRSMPTSESVSKLRGVTPVGLRRQLAGDLDAIVMRAIRKEPGSRYSSVGHMADDLGRYLQGLPVRARQGTWRYRASKFVRRNRAAVGAVIAVFLVLVAAGVTSTLFAFQAKKEAQAATQARDEANRQANLAQAVSDFLRDDFLAAVAPEEQGKDVSMRVVLDAASKSIADKFQDLPLGEASVRATFGSVYVSLGEYHIAAPHLERALMLRRKELGEDHLETIACMSYLAELYYMQGRIDESESLFVEALEASRRTLGEDDSDTISSMTNLAIVYTNQDRHDEAEALLLSALQTVHRVLGKDHLSALNVKNSLAILYKNQGRYDDAEPLYVETLEGCRRALGENHPQTLASMGNLAHLYDDQGRYDEAEPLLVAALEAKRRVLGEDHPGTLLSMNNLAALYYKRGRYDEAEPLFVTALEAKLRVLGEDHSLTALAMANLAQLYAFQGRYDEAGPLNIKALQLQRRILGEDHTETLISKDIAAALYMNRGRYDEAESLYVETLERRRRVLGEEHPHTLSSMCFLAGLYTRQGRYDDAEPLFVKALEAARRTLGPDHPTTPYIMSSLATLYTSQSRYEEAEPLYRTALKMQRRVLGEGQLHTLITMNKLARLYRKLTRYDEAERLCVSALDGFRPVLGEDHPMALETRDNLAAILGYKGETERAEHMLRRVIDLQVAKFGVDHPSVMTTENHLAELLQRLGAR